MAGPCLRALFVLASSLLVLGCAMGTRADDDDDDPQADASAADAHLSTAIDAPAADATPDASTALPDASMSQPDAGTGGCTTNADCGLGTCCFVLVCVPGLPVPLPPPLNCVPS